MLPSQWTVKYPYNNMAFINFSFNETSKKPLLVIKEEGERERGRERERETERDFMTVTRDSN